ncbi:Putative Cutinase transcription factor 1 beta [[Torrubiella] hemipterigena]|uniref:Putative Cutinase transcription factor 1 beta n=1 Tax=[Torrubiella] hemipterigena TaxID=1531966 RepID=A0A0A1TSC2_9HYPO|nr:Putative Cutinase transcription factor 1 beta [[Torrubiella] hemipterigena]
MVITETESARNRAAGRVVKRRSPKACVSCHNRKVRCDVVNGGWPCTNCRLDGVDCLLKESNRGRKPGSVNPKNTGAATRRASRPVAATVTPTDNRAECDEDVLDSSMNDQAHTIPRLSQPAYREEHHLSPQSDTSRLSELQEQPHQCTHSPNQPFPSSPGPDTEPSSAPRDFLFALAFENGSQQQSPGQTTTNSNKRALHGSQSSTHSTSPNVLPHTTSERNQSEAGRMSSHCSVAQNSPRHHILPPYIKPLPARIKSRDIDYLTEGGCLNIPDDDLRDELLRVYIRFVYPFMPAIDIEDFITPIFSPDSRRPVSLLLFQAIMFVSITFIDSEFLKSRGHQSRRAAREVFFDRVHSLYSFKIEDDKCALVQSLLLMTYWYGSPEDDRDTWHWMGIALGTAQVAGFHMDPRELSISPKEKQLRRRIWWSCVIRDRLIGLGIRRPTRVRDEEMTNPLLTLDDFDLEPSSALLVGVLGESKFNYVDTETKTGVAKMCIELSRLAIIVGHVLHSQYTVAGTDNSSSEFLLRAVVRPKQSPDQAASLIQCDTELKNWFDEQGLGPMRTDSPENDSTDILRLYYSLLQTIYFTTVSALHRPQAFYTGSSRNNSSSMKEHSRKKVQDAAISLTKLAFDVQSRNLLRYSSTSSIPAFLSATLIHLINTRSNDEEIRNISVGRFYHCLGALQQLQDMYASAEYAVNFVKTVLRTAHLDTPLLTGGFSREWGDQSQWHDSATSPANAATSYPSPSASGRQTWHGLATAKPHMESNQRGPGMHTSGATYSGVATQPPWPPMATPHFSAGPQFDVDFGSPYLGILGDMDILDPSLALMSFDTDPSFLLTK